MSNESLKDLIDIIETLELRLADIEIQLSTVRRELQQELENE